MIAEIIAIGSELLTPFRQDTNSLFLTERLNELGVQVAFKGVVGDNRDHLVSVTRIALSRSDIVIFMGGLGPTEDDLTREAVAEAMRLPLKRNPDIVADLYARFAARRIKMTENNVKQADVITGAAVLKNNNGSAPGQWLEGEYEGKQKIVILLPGPPVELKPMFVEQCLDRLRVKVPQQFIATRVLKIALMPESECDARCAPIYKEHNAVQTTILAGAGDVQLHLKASADTMEEAQQLVDDLAEELEDELDDRVYSTKGESLEQIVGYYLQMRGATLAVAESCTGGLLSERITSVPGSSRYFLGGAIVYANDLKTSFSDVPPMLIAEHGAVSKEVALALAEGIRKRCNATLGVGVTGIAGPTGGTPEKPVGLVYIAVADGKKPEVVERKLPGDRDRIRFYASQQALDMVRRKMI
ncbi:MAG: competence/damage-inducible protein cinA [Acidobacteriaceae bacterium]|nr:competence/damage-inducible protein cinA [Acidobacteriaceae bacterium]